jgi:hypothetical protein
MASWTSTSRVVAVVNFDSRFGGCMVSEQSQVSGCELRGTHCLQTRSLHFFSCWTLSVDAVAMRSSGTVQTTGCTGSHTHLHAPIWHTKSHLVCQPDLLSRCCYVSPSCARQWPSLPPQVAGTQKAADTCSIWKHLMCVTIAMVETPARVSILTPMLQPLACSEPRFWLPAQQPRIQCKPAHMTHCSGAVCAAHQNYAIAADKQVRDATLVCLHVQHPRSVTDTVPLTCQWAPRVRHASAACRTPSRPDPQSAFACSACTACAP